jgi:hypothetical protein
MRWILWVAGYFGNRSWASISLPAWSAWALGAGLVACACAVSRGRGGALDKV